MSFPDLLPQCQRVLFKRLRNTTASVQTSLLVCLVEEIQAHRSWQYGIPIDILSMHGMVLVSTFLVGSVNRSRREAASIRLFPLLALDSPAKQPYLWWEGTTTSRERIGGRLAFAVGLPQCIKRRQGHWTISQYLIAVAWMELFVELLIPS